MLPLPTGLSNEKIDLVQEYLDLVPNAMHFEHVDGFFCALICGPDAVPPSEFLPYIFGGQMPRFQSQEQADAVMNALTEHWQHIAETMNDEKPYYPFLFADHEEKCAANDWADAFMLGIQLRQEQWKDLLEDESDEPLLRQIVMLRNELHESEDGKTLTIPGDERELMVETIVANLNKIFDHYAEQREEQEPQQTH